MSPRGSTPRNDPFSSSERSITFNHFLSTRSGDNEFYNDNEKRRTESIRLFRIRIRIKLSTQ